MSFDAKLILAALDKHFDAVEARWDRFFAAQDQKWAKKVVHGDVPGEHHFQAPNSTDEIRTRSCLTSTELPVAAVAGREPPLAARVTSTTACTTGIVVNVGPFSAEQQTSDTKHMAPATSSSATTTSPPTASSAAAIDIQHGATAASSASTRSLAPAARGADEDNTTNITPTRCLMQVHSSDIALIASPTSCGSSLGTNKHDPNVSIDLLASYDGSTQVLRYINPMTPSLPSGIAMLCVAIGGHEYEKVLERMTSPSIVLLGTGPTQVFDRTMATSSFSIQLCFSFYPPISWANMQHRTPWPPPMQCEVQVDAIRLRPAPWPSFSSLAMEIQWAKVLSRMFCYSIGLSIVKPFFEYNTDKCLQHWLEFYVTVVQVVGFIRKEAIAGVQLTHGAILFVSEACQCHFSWLMADSLQYPSWNVLCTSCKHNKKDKDFVLWIPLKPPGLFSVFEVSRMLLSYHHEQPVIDVVDYYLDSYSIELQNVQFGYERFSVVKKEFIQSLCSVGLAVHLQKISQPLSLFLDVALSVELHFSCFVTQVQPKISTLKFSNVIHVQVIIMWVGSVHDCCIGKASLAPILLYQLRAISCPFFLKHYVPVHWVNLLQMEVIDSATEVQTSGFCQINVLFKAPWPPPDGSQVLGCQYLDWYLIQKKGVGLWTIYINMLLLLPIVAGTTSGTTATMHLQASLSMVIIDSMSKCMRRSPIDDSIFKCSTQWLQFFANASDCMPSSQYLVLPRLLCATMVDIRPQPSSLKNKNTLLSDNVDLHSYYYELLSDLPVIAKSIDQRDLQQRLSFRVQQQQISDVLLTSIIVTQQLILWDLGVDQCLLAEFESLISLGNLQMQQAFLSFFQEERAIGFISVSLQFSLDF